MAFIKKYTFKQCGEFNKKEISRYAGNLQDEALLSECISEVSSKLVYNVCYQKFPVSKQGNKLDLGFAQTSSADLSKCSG